MVYRPSVKSFLASLVYDLSPLASAAVVMYFLGNSGSLVLKVASGVMAVFSLFLVVQSISVHSKNLYLNESGIASSGLISRNGIRWSDIKSAVLRERNNAVTRTDRLLVLESNHHVFSYVVSTLSPKQEAQVLDAVRAQTQLVVYQDKRAI